MRNQTLLQVDNEFRFSILSLNLFNQTLFVVDGEGRLQPILDITGDLFLPSGRGWDTFLVQFKFIIVADESGAFKLNSASAVFTRLNANLGGEPDTRVLATQLTDPGEDLGRVPIPEILKVLKLILVTHKVVFGK